MKNYFLIFSRRVWEVWIEKGIYSFTKEQLDSAEMSEDGYIGTYQSKHSVTGVDCYIQKLFK